MVFGGGRGEDGEVGRGVGEGLCWGGGISEKLLEVKKIFDGVGRGEREKR